MSDNQRTDYRPTVTCVDCGDTGMLRWLGRSNDEEVSECPTCEIRHLKGLLQEVLDDMIFCVAPNKGTLAKIEMALRK